MGVPPLLRILAQEVDLRLIPGLRGAPGLDTEEEERFHEEDKVGLNKGFEEADVDAITATALLPELRPDLRGDLVHRKECPPDVRWSVHVAARVVWHRGSGGVAALEELEILRHRIHRVRCRKD